MLDLTKATENIVFDYKVLRLLVGIIALTLPYAVISISRDALVSISASYYTEARDLYVGLLFVVAAFLWAYNGHNIKQAIASKIAAVATILVALLPTSCPGCDTSVTSVIHFSAAATLFSILAYFCLGPFRENTSGHPGKKGRRAVVYLVCGWLMVTVMLIALVAELSLTQETIDELRIIFWVELVALNAFGVAWITAGKYLPMLVDEEDAPRLLKRRQR